MNIRTERLLERIRKYLEESLEVISLRSVLTQVLVNTKLYLWFDIKAFPTIHMPLKFWLSPKVGMKRTKVSARTPTRLDFGSRIREGGAPLTV